MRLSEQERLLIRHAVQTRFEEQAEVLLFGSRTDDTARGSDIDLLIRLAETPANEFRQVLMLETDLQEALGDQKIDILVWHPESQESAIRRIAQNTGIPM